MLLNYILADGRTNWFEGMILIRMSPSIQSVNHANNYPDLYILVAVAFWFYPGKNEFVFSILGLVYSSYGQVQTQRMKCYGVNQMDFVY